MTILEEANQIINGPRQDAYGPVEESFRNIAIVWSAILKLPISPRHVALCMIGLKLVREAHKPGRDNRTDICGYTGLLDRLEEVLTIDQP